MDGIIIAAIIVLALLGTPLFAVFGGAAMLLFARLPDAGTTGAANDVFSEKFADSPLLVTIPLFTFAGYLMAESGTPRRLVEVSRAWLGWLPGGLAIVCLVASAFFTTFTGGSGITIVAIGGLLYPALIRDEYDEKFSLGLITTGGSLGLLFPPSLPIVLYGVVAGVLIEKLFLAGIIPGFITVLMLAGYAVYVGVKHKMRRTPFDARHAFQTLWHAKWEVLLPVVLLGGMYSGLMRIHEAAAFTAIYVLIVEVWVYRDVTFRHDLPRIIRESMTLVGAILAILATAIGFTAYLIQAQVPMKILDAMEVLISSKIMFLLVLNVFLLGVGMLMDIFSAIVVVVPLIVPLANYFGVDPYHLGIVFLLNLEIGYMTPPVGLNLFIASFRFGKPVTLLYRAVLPFIGLLVLALVAITYMPRLSIWATELIENEGIIQQPESMTPGGTEQDDMAPAQEGMDLDLEDQALDEPEDDEGALTLDDLDTLEDGGEGEGDGEPTLDELLEDEGAEEAPDDEGGEETLDDLLGE